jgi:phage gpG-like protein
MIHGTVDASNALIHLERVTPRVHDALVKTLTAIGFDLQGYIQRSKLSGQVLHQRSGWLSSHVHPQTTDGGTTITTVVGVDASAVPYARIHEYGGTITAKRAKYLRFMTADGSWHMVRSVTMPERSYMRSGLADKRDAYVEQMRNAARSAAA